MFEIESSHLIQDFVFKNASHSLILSTVSIVWLKKWAHMCVVESCSFGTGDPEEERARMKERFIRVMQQLLEGQPDRQREFINFFFPSQQGEAANQATQTAGGCP